MLFVAIDDCDWNIAFVAALADDDCCCIKLELDVLLPMFDGDDDEIMLDCNDEADNGDDEDEDDKCSKFSWWWNIAPVWAVVKCEETAGIKIKIKWFQKTTDRCPHMH